MDGARPRFVFYTAGTGGILVGVVLFKPRCSDWCSEFHVKAFLLLIITPHVVFTAEFRQTFLVTWVARRTFWWLTDWSSFILRFHQSECLQLTGDWLLSYPMPFAMCFCAPGVWSRLHTHVFSNDVWKFCCDWRPNSYRLQRADTRGDAFWLQDY